MVPKSNTTRNPKTVITLIRYDSEGKRMKPVRLSWESDVELIFRPKAA